MANIVPSNWTMFANNGNQVQFLLPGHTVLKPRFCLFSRTVPSLSGNGSSVPAVRVRVLEGVLDADGKPVATKISVDTTIRNDLTAPVANVVADVLEVGRMLSNAVFVQQLVEQQRLPTAAPWDVV